MRTAYGSQVFERQVLASPRLARLLGASPAGADLDPRIGSAVAMGADLRAAYLYGAVPNEEPALDTFYLMQTDLYISADLGRRTTLYLDQGVYGSFEAFGLFHYRLREEPLSPRSINPPSFSCYLKAGRFVPSFGIRMEDHYLYTREGFGFGPSRRVTGLEAGVYVGDLFFQASYVKGALTDQDREGTWLGRVEWQSKGKGPRWILGASGTYTRNTVVLNPSIQPTLDVTEGAMQWQVGMHALASIGRFTLLGEAAHVSAQAEIDDSRGRALVSLAQLSFLPWQGVELIASHEYADPDLLLASGASQRLGGAIEVHPWVYSSFRFDVRHTFADDPNPLAGMNEVLGMLHLFF